MAYVFKVSKKGHDVTNGKGSKRAVPEDTSGKPIPSLLYVIAQPYLLGASTQLNRYKEATKLLKDETSGMGVTVCLHEMSSLFEHLATVAKYMQICGHKNDFSELCILVRNHIRHDVRENFEKESEKRKVERSKALGIGSTLEAEIEFRQDAIRVGNVIIEVSAIEAYLVWSGKIIIEAMDDARKRGYLRSE